MSRRLKKQIRWIIILVVISVSLLSLMLFKFHSDKVTTAQKEISKTLRDISEYQKEIDNFYENSEYVFLKKDVSQRKAEQLGGYINVIKSKASDYKVSERSIQSELKPIKEQKKTVQHSFSSLQNKIDGQIAINNLFVKTNEPAINGSSINRDLYVTDTITTKKFSTIKQEYYSETNKSNSKDAWQVAVDELISIAGSQVEQIDLAKKLVDDLLNQDSNSQEITGENISKAQAEVDKILNPSIRSQLTSQLANIQNEVKEKENILASKSDTELLRYTLAMFIKINQKSQEKNLFTVDGEKDEDGEFIGKVKGFDPVDKKTAVWASFTMAQNGYITFQPVYGGPSLRAVSQAGETFKEISADDLNGIREDVSKVTLNVKTIEQFTDFILSNVTFADTMSKDSYTVTSSPSGEDASYEFVFTDIHTKDKYGLKNEQVFYAKYIETPVISSSSSSSQSTDRSSSLIDSSEESSSTNSTTQVKVEQKWELEKVLTRKLFYE